MNSTVPTIERCREVAAVLKNLAHPQRLLLLCLLAEGPRRVTDLTELSGASQSAVSQFLTRMKLEGLVACDRDGQSVVYRIAAPDVARLLMALHEIYCPADAFSA